MNVYENLLLTLGMVSHYYHVTATLKSSRLLSCSELLSSLLHMLSHIKHCHQQQIALCCLQH